MSNKATTRRSPRGGESQGESTKRRGMASAFAKEEEAVQKKRDGQFMPFRLWIKPGEDVAVTFLDESLDAGFYRREHNLKIDGKWGNHEPCRAEIGKCEHCAENSTASLVAFLSVIVHKPYTSKKTGETKEHSKMLYTFKRGQYEAMERLEKVALKKYGTLRGVTVWLSRKDEENSFSTGEPVPNGEGDLIDDFYTEDDLVESFGHAAVKGRESGKVVKEANEDIKPYPYRKLMPPPSADDENAPRTPGSRADSDEEYDEDDEVPGIENPRRPRRKQRAAPLEAEDEALVGEAELVEADGKVLDRARRRTRPKVKADSEAAAPVVRKRTRSRAVDSDDDEGEPSFED